MIWFAFLKDHYGCMVEKVLQLCKNGSKDTSQEANGRVQVRDHGDLYSIGGQGARGKQIDSRSIVKIEPERLPDVLHMECKESRGIKDDSEAFDL